MLAMTLIAPPAWARPFHRSVDKAFGDENLNLIQAHRDAILAIVHQAVQSYIDNPLLTWDTEEQGFPARDRLTGEYYLGAEHYRVNDEPWFARVGRQREHRFSFEACCLERVWHENQQGQDYLGLEVHFDWLPDAGTFRFDGDVDSAVI
jgi:hypothetical protein